MAHDTHNWFNKTTPLVDYFIIVLCCFVPSFRFAYDAFFLLENSQIRFASIRWLVASSIIIDDCKCVMNINIYDRFWASKNTENEGLLENVRKWR